MLLCAHGGLSMAGQQRSPRRRANAAIPAGRRHGEGPKREEDWSQCVRGLLLKTRTQTPGASTPSVVGAVRDHLTCGQLAPLTSFPKWSRRRASPRTWRCPQGVCCEVRGAAGVDGAVVLLGSEAVPGWVRAGQHVLRPRRCPCRESRRLQATEIAGPR